MVWGRFHNRWRLHSYLIFGPLFREGPPWHPHTPETFSIAGQLNCSDCAQIEIDEPNFLMHLPRNSCAARIVRIMLLPRRDVTLACQIPPVPVPILQICHSLYIISSLFGCGSPSPPAAHVRQFLSCIYVYCLGELTQPYSANGARHAASVAIRLHNHTALGGRRPCPPLIWFRAAFCYLDISKRSS